MSNMENFKEEKQYKVTIALKSGKYMDVNVSIEERDSLIKLLKNCDADTFSLFFASTSTEDDVWVPLNSIEFISIK